MYISHLTRVRKLFNTLRPSGARIYASTSVTQTVICSDNGVPPERHQAIIRTNAGILSTVPQGESPGIYKQTVTVSTREGQ